MRKSLPPTLREELAQRLGCACANCGSTDGVEFHHIVPVRMGGTNNITNFTVLCFKCHLAVHGLNAATWRRGGGRKRIEIDENVLDDYFKCRIGTAECKELLGFAQNTHLTDRANIREYMRKCGIKAYRNNVDLLRVQDRRIGHKVTSSKDIVGWIEYTDGRREEFDRSSLRTPI